MLPEIVSNTVTLNETTWIQLSLLYFTHSHHVPEHSQIMLFGKPFPELGLHISKESFIGLIKSSLNAQLCHFWYLFKTSET